MLYGMLFLSQTAAVWNILVLMDLSFSGLQWRLTDVSGLSSNISRCMGQYCIQLLFFFSPGNNGKGYLSSPYLRLSKCLHFNNVLHNKKVCDRYLWYFSVSR